MTSIPQTYNDLRLYFGLLPLEHPDGKLSMVEFEEKYPQAFEAFKNEMASTSAAKLESCRVKRIELRECYAARSRFEAAVGLPASVINEQTAEFLASDK